MSLQDLGLGRKRLEEQIEEEVGGLKEEVEKTCGESQGSGEGQECVCACTPVQPSSSYHMTLNKPFPSLFLLFFTTTKGSSTPSAFSNWGCSPQPQGF